MFSSPHERLFCLSFLCFFMAFFGLVYHWISFLCVKNFQCKDAELRASLKQNPQNWPKLSVLKPLYGHIPLLEEAVETLIHQDYPAFEILFGVMHAKDPAVCVIQSLQAKYPDKKIKLVISSESHGLNRKISNLINLQAEAENDIFVIADADIFVPPYWLKYIVRTLQKPKTALVTAPYVGISARSANLWQSFSRLGINSSFLPGVLVSRFLGRRDCFGATMALTRRKLSEIGGFPAIIDYVADDAKLGKLVQQTGEEVALLPTFTLTSVTENSFSKLMTHELRWGRTTKSVQPLAYAASILQFSLVWASCAFFLMPKILTLVFLGAVLLSRWLSAALLEKTLIPEDRHPKTFRGKFYYLLTLFPIIFLREWLSAFIIIVSFFGKKVKWAGLILSAIPIDRKKA